MRKALVVGFGKSGKSAASFLKKRGHTVYVFDEKVQECSPYLPFEKDLLIDRPLVIVSPGVPIDHPLVQEAETKGCEVISEVELALREKKNPIIGVTGTNGKTTTVLLLEHFFTNQGKEAKAVGNVGMPITSYEGKGVLIIELSSFQLQKTFTPALDLAIILNITPNHLDHHRSYKEYIEAKLHICNLLKPDGHLLVNPSIKKQFFAEEERVVPFKTKRNFSSHLPKENLAAAFLAAKYFSLDLPSCYKAASSFVSPPHRMEYLGCRDGLHWINDSKATTPEAVVHAAKSIKRPFILIVGGVDKKLSFTIWKKKLPDNIKSIIAMGFAAKKIEQSLESRFEVNLVETLQDAISLAKKRAKKGETVLLSPGCTSFDQFKNFEERGNFFKEMVDTLGEP